MKKTIKRILSIMLVIVMIIGTAPLVSFVGLELPEINLFSTKAEAEEMTTSGTCGENLTWSFNTETNELLISGTGAMTNWDSSSYVPWYSIRSNVKAIIVSDGITSIGKFAFYNCTNTTKVLLPNSLIKIGEYAFYYCNNLICANYYGTLEQWQNVSIEPYNTILTNNVICDCNSIRPYYFGTCGENLNWKLYTDGELFISGIGNMHDWCSCSEVPWYTKRNEIKEISICSGVNKIGDYAFYNFDSLIKVSIPETITTIGEHSFEGCGNIENINIPNGVINIENSAFRHCTKLSNLQVGDSVQSIGKEAFYMCMNLVSLVIPDNILKIDDMAFSCCFELENITLPNEAFNIGRDVFSNTAYYNDNLNWDNDVIYIGNHLIKSKKEIAGVYEIKYGTLSIAGMAFYDCDNISSVIIPNTVVNVGHHAFAKGSNVQPNGITNIMIPNSVLYIGESAFKWCSSLRTIYFDSGIKNIADYAFEGCKGITDVYYEGSKEQWNDIVIGLNNEYIKNATIHFGQELETQPDPIAVYVNAYTTVDGSVAQFKEYGITISSDDTNAPLPNITYSVTNNLGCVSFPIEFTEDDLEGLSSKTFIYDLTISSANGKKYDFIPETQQVKITITNSNGELSQTVGEDEYRFDGYSYYDYTVTLVWDDHDNVCGVRPESLDLTLVSHLGDVSIPFTLNKDNRWSVVLSVRNVNDDDYFHRYSVEGFDSDVGYEYDVRTYESYNKNGANITATLPICYVSFVTQYGAAPEKQSLIRGSLVTEPEQPTDPCYVFVGWYKNEECTEGMKWNFETDKVTQRTTLYAKWDVKLIDITLKTEYGILQAGGNSKELVTTIPAGSVVGIKLSEELYDSNNMHIGWVDSEGNEVSSFTKFYEDTTLYAVWQKKPYFNSTVSIKNNTGSKTINYGETLKLTAIVTDKPADAKIYWYIDGAKKGEGETFNVSFKNGTKTVEVKLVDANGNVLKNESGNEIKDSEKVTVNGGFFQKIISFFKNLFGINRTVVQAIFKSVL